MSAYTHLLLRLRRHKRPSVLEISQPRCTNMIPHMRPRPPNPIPLLLILHLPPVPPSPRNLPRPLPLSRPDPQPQNRAPYPSPLPPPHASPCASDISNPFVSTHAIPTTTYACGDARTQYPWLE